MINQNSTKLPITSKLEQTHSKTLCAQIKQQIEVAGGAVSFAEFMQQALYSPGLGYYSAGQTKLGAQGDFITAPELSPLFGHTIAKQCNEVLANLSQKNLLELGAGTGKLASDILTYLKQINKLPDKYFILEVSADLKQRQQQLLQKIHPELMDRVHWLSSLPNNFCGVILANEVIDAMPVHLFHWDNQQLQELMVSYDKNFSWQLGPANKALQQAFLHLTNELDLNNWQTPYTSEVNLLLKSWVTSLADCLAKGVILLIDYGFPRHEYYHPQRNQGTLMCHYRHHAHTDPLTLVGLQDITAHVDFTVVAEAGTQAGLTLEGFTNQASFLLNNGLTTLIPAETEKNLSIKSAIKKLTHPHEMGELFKAIGFSKNYVEELTGFSNNDQSHRL